MNTSALAMSEDKKPSLPSKRPCVRDCSDKKIPLNNSSGGRTLNKTLPRTSLRGAVRAQQISRKLLKMLYKGTDLACECGESFPTTRSLRYHMKYCEKMVCCDRRFTNVGTMRTHIAYTHDFRPLPSEITLLPKCRFCGNEFKSAKGRDQHVSKYCKANPNLF